MPRAGGECLMATRAGRRYTGQPPASFLPLGPHAMHLARLLPLAIVALGFVSTLRAEDAPKHVAVTPKPRDAGWVKRHEGFVERIKKGNVDLLFIGDSITD